MRLELSAPPDTPAGEARLESVGLETRVVISLSPGYPDAAAAIYRVPCGSADAGPAYTLEPVVGGRSESLLAVSLKGLLGRASSVRIRNFDDVDDFEAFPIACGDFGSRPQPPPISARRAAEIASCYTPDEFGYGFERGSCASIEKIERIGNDVWRIRLRLPPVYCVDAHLGEYRDDLSTDVEGLGWLEEVRCPAEAYPREREPDLVVSLRGVRGTVTLIDDGQRRTRVIVEANVDVGWIRHGTCRNPAGGRRLDLDQFYSFRSVTTLPVTVDSLTKIAHALEVDAGGAHGGDPIGCADLTRTPR